MHVVCVFTSLWHHAPTLVQLSFSFLLFCEIRMLCWSGHGHGRGSRFFLSFYPNMNHEFVKIFNFGIKLKRGTFVFVCSHNQLMKYSIFFSPPFIFAQIIMTLWLFYKKKCPKLTNDCQFLSLNSLENMSKLTHEIFSELEYVSQSQHFN